MSRQGEARTRTIENVKDFWNQEASEWGENPRVTIRDHYFRILEIDTVCNLIRGGTNALDIGCGTGLSTLFYSQCVKSILGVDYAERMVEWAKRLLQDPEYFQKTMKDYAPDGSPTLGGNISFEEGNIMNLELPSNSFDRVISERVLINLPQVELQDKAVAEVVRVMQPGGLLTLVEVTKQGHENVDRVRELFGLPIIEKYWHNLYIDENHFSKFAQEIGLDIREIQRFETYQFLTKVIHPLVTAPEEPKFMAGFNNAARKIAKEYPTYASVKEIGLESFLTDKFRPLLEELDSEKVSGYDRIVDVVLKTDPDFATCSHQVLFVLARR